MTRNSKQIAKSNPVGRIASTIGLVLVAVLIFVAITMTTGKKPINESIWNDAMTMGDTEAPKKHYIMYTDIMCPYCDVFTRATIAHEEEFNKYLRDNHILFEIRMTDMLYSSGIKFSKIAASGAYCAADEGKFWEYYHESIKKLWEDYHSKGIGDSKTSPAITDMTNDWWLSLDSRAGLSDEWRECVLEDKFADAVSEATTKTYSSTNGLPYFDLNGTKYGGLPGGSYFETWAELEEFLNTGL